MHTQFLSCAQCQVGHHHYLKLDNSFTSIGQGAVQTFNGMAIVSYICAKKLNNNA